MSQEGAVLRELMSADEQKEVEAKEEEKEEEESEEEGNGADTEM
jgi:hypothetical protein